MKIKIQDLVQCALMAALVAAGAFIRVPLPGGDYITMQFIFVALTGMLLGQKKGTLAMGAYVLLGLLGVPVFAGGGGIGYVLKPSFGYLLGFVLAAFWGGRIADGYSGKGRFWMSGLVTLAVVYIMGMGYKYLLLNVFLGQPLPWQVLLLSVVPMLPKDLIACALAALLAGRLSKAVGFNHQTSSF